VLELSSTLFQHFFRSLEPRHSALPCKRKYVLYHRRTRLSNLLAAFALYLLSTLASRLPDLAVQLSRRQHHTRDALRYKSSSYNTWTRTANPLDSIFLKVLRLSQCLGQQFPVTSDSCLRKAQERRLSPLLPSVKSWCWSFYLISPSQSFLRPGERRADKTTAKKPWASCLCNLRMGNTRELSC
jgi:hypothetical protein